MNDPFKEHPHGITRIDTGYVRPGFAAAYLVEKRGRAVFIETGPQHAVPRLLQALERRKLSREAVEAVIVTHIHLDHAGGAGALLQHLPNARLIVHARGARHLIDPSKLLAGATAVYGEETFKQLLGGITPAPADRVHTPGDGERFSLQGRILTFFDSPGHARHHLCVQDAESDGLFTGDAFGISYREFDRDGTPFLFPATTPVQFDPVASHRTIDRLAALAPRWIHLTHFDHIPFSTDLVASLHRQLDRFTDLAIENDSQPSGTRQHRLLAAMRQVAWEQLTTHHPGLDRERCAELLAMDWEINAQGLAIWLEKRQRS